MVKPKGEKGAGAHEARAGRGDLSSGEVVLSRADWLALRERIEDLEDALVVERFRKAHGPGTDAFVPEAVASRILDGEAPLKVWRTHLSLTQEMLAELSGVSRAMIADIETGRKRGSVDTILALEAALGLKSADLF